ncbi:hypothetical protein [Natrononativus amylolyticus]|uniref:hypothetical protein n=1 Tax=Natrononativus amylolyticus TaxID=2963434 RepID=UPI0020CF2C4A|nr:hypothetical protein [Natrononativus amylolyticus]
MDDLTAAGVDRLKLAAHYHSVRTFDPKADDLGFVTFPGGCLFEPDEACFAETPIDPPDALDGRTPPFGDLVATATDRGLAVDAWLVCFHGTRLASEWPAYRIEDAFGTAHSHALCPSHPEVREYFAGVVRNLARSGVDRIDLESAGFPSVLHDHGANFGHHKDHVIRSRASEFLVSQCFCDGCRRAAGGAVDVEAARTAVVDLCHEYVADAGEAPALSELVAADPLLADLFEFRTAVIGEFLDDLAAASGETRLSYYLADGGGYGPSELWPAGVTPAALEAAVDDVTALCYTADLAEIDARLSACRETLDHPLDVGLTLDPEVVADREEWKRLREYVGERIDGDVFVYNHALLPEDRLEWLDSRGPAQRT